MSMFSIPEELLPNLQMLDEMKKQTKAHMPAEFASTINLMAHPLAGAAAMTAISVGFASQAMGFWFGTMSGAAAASQRMFAPIADNLATDAKAFRDAARTAEMRAEAVATTLIDDVADAVVPPAERQPVVRRPKKASAETIAKPSQADIAQPDSGEAVGAVDATEPITPAIDPSLDALAEPTPAIAETVMDIAVEAPAALAPTPMADTPRKPYAIDKPEAPDDLKAISGVGPKLEQVLNGLGVWTYAQIAKWDAAEIAWVDDTLGFKGRIGRDDWIGQATKLASSAALAANPADGSGS